MMRTDRRMEPPEGGGDGGGGSSSMERTTPIDSSGASYKSTHSSRSSVLERAREYNRRIDEQKLHQSMNSPVSSDHESPRGRRPRRSKSWTRSTVDSVASSSADTRSSSGGNGTNIDPKDGMTKSLSKGATPRSQSTGRIPNKSHYQSRAPTPEYQSDPTRMRAMESVRHQPNQRGPSSERTQPLTPSGHSTQYSSSQSSGRVPVESTSLPDQSGASHPNQTSRMRRDQSKQSRNTQAITSPQEEVDEPVAVVPPELLVEALSGQEDGLLAIAEKLMEHYDAGYDVMGEAIIDAFADVQKLFQHVVEAAHMEGAAFEAARREEEHLMDPQLPGGGSPLARMHNGAAPATPTTAANNSRLDEFLDQDVKDLLSEAIRTGSVWRAENRKVQDVFQMYMTVCIDASNLLPVDSDHRTRLQLSVNRAESMTPDRACAILRYGIDDVLRSGLRAEHAPASASMTDPGQQQRRAENVLNRNAIASSAGNPAVVQSSDEALASLMEELKDMLQAPIYADTPLEHVSRRFWAALTDAHKMQQKNEERLEQNLGRLKGEFLLAQAEWEEKLSQSTLVAESFKKKYQSLMESMKKEEFTAEHTMHNASSIKSQMVNDDAYHDMSSTVYGSVKSVASKAETVASGVSGLAQQARSLVMNSSFNCVAGGSSANGMQPDDDFDDDYDGDDRGGDDIRAEMEFETSPPNLVTRGRSGPSDQQHHPPRSSSKRYYSRSPHRVDI